MRIHWCNRQAFRLARTAADDASFFAGRGLPGDPRNQWRHQRHAGLRRRNSSRRMGARYCVPPKSLQTVPHRPNGHPGADSRRDPARFYVSTFRSGTALPARRATQNWDNKQSGCLPHRSASATLMTSQNAAMNCDAQTSPDGRRNEEAISPAGTCACA